MKIFLPLFSFSVLFNFTVFAQWVPALENTQNRIVDLISTDKNRFIASTFETYNIDGDKYFKYSDDEGQNWQSIKGVTLPNYAGVGVLGKQGANSFASTSSGGIYKSKDNGQTWVLKASTTGSRYIKFTSNSKYAIFADDESYAGLLISENEGENWNKISVPTSYISGISIRTDTIFVSAQYDIYRGVKAGSNWSWTKFNPTPSGLANDYSGVSSPIDKTIIVTARANGGIFVSSDGGNNWNSPTISDAQGATVRGFEHIYIFDGYWVLSTTKNLGKIFVSNNKGNTWIDFSAGLPLPFVTNYQIKEVPVSKILVQNGVLYAVIGNSIWKRPLNEFVNNFLERPTAVKTNVEFRNTNIISWLDNSRSETGFIIERAINSTTNFVEVARVGSNVISYIDENQEGGKTYYYRVKSYNASTTSANSEIVKIERPANICKVVKRLIYSSIPGTPFFINENTGFAWGGGYDQVYLKRTNDGGKTWSEVDLIVTPKIYSTSRIIFLDEKTGFIFGDNDNNYITIDGGITWRTATLKDKIFQQNYNLLRKKIPLSEFYLTDSVGFKGGSGLARTGDAGKSWISLGSNFSYVTKIFFTDSKNGFFIQQDGRIGKTTDGGDSWAFLNLPIQFNQLADLSTTDGKTLYFSGNKNYDDSPVIISTSDNGKTFTTYNISLKTKDGISGVCFSGKKAWIRTTNRDLYVSEDGLKTWEIIDEYATIYRSSTSFKGQWGLVGSTFYDNDNNSKSVIYTTKDAGKSWQNLNLMTKSYNVFGPKVKIFDVNKAIVLAEDILYKTFDGGKTWQSYTVPFSTSTKGGFIYNYFFVNEKVWYLNHRFDTENEYKLYKTTDGGITWQYQPQVINPYEMFFFVNENVGFVKGNGTGIYRTVDGGNNWTTFNPTLSQYMYAESIYFIDANTGFVGSGFSNTTELVRTTDGCKTWQKVSLPTNIQNIGRIYKIKFFNKLIGYAQAGNNKIIYTTDGGLTWILADSLEDVLSKLSSVVDFDDYYEEGSSGSFSNLYRYELLKPSAKPHQPNGLIDACFFNKELIYSIDNNNSYSYDWKLSGGGTLSTTRNEARIKWSGLGTYKLSVKTSNDCGQSEWQEANITVRGLANKPTLQSGNITPCTNTNVVYKLNPVNNYNYEWFFPTGVNAAINKNEATVNWTQESKNFVIGAIAKDTFCPSDTLFIEVTTKGVPVTPVITFQQPNLISSSAINNQWMIDGKNINDATNQIYIPNQGIGQYSVKVTNECGSATSRAFAIVVTENEPERELRLMIFPNPASEKLNIKQKLSQPFSIKIYDLSGRIMKSLEDFIGEANIDISDLNTGTYILNINQKEKNQVEKIVIIR